MGLSRYLAKLGALIGSDGKVPTAGLADGAVTNAKMGAGAAVSNIGYPPAPSQFANLGNVSSTGGVWVRLAKLNNRYAFRVTVGTTGGWYSPGATTFTMFRSWSNDLTVSGVVKVNSQFATKIRTNAGGSDGDVYLEVYHAAVDSRSGNAVNSFEHFAYVRVDPLGPPSTLLETPQCYGGNMSSLGYISNEVVL